MSGTQQTSDPLVRSDGEPWDLLVVGGGTAGLVATNTAAGLGARVLLVERDRPGGDCLWTGCVPSKSLLAAAHAAADARSASRLGVHVGEVTVDFAAVMAHTRAAIATIEPADSPDAVRRKGGRFAHGEVRFTGPTSATVDGSPVDFRRAILATGSAPLVPGLPGLSDAAPLTSDDVWELTELPERLLVLGGGAIGCELGQAFARLGSRVSIVEQADRLLAREEPAASTAVEAAFREDGIEILTGTALTAVEPDGDGFLARLDDGSSIGFDRVLVAVGRRPRTGDLGLDAAGVDLDQRQFVVVDPRLRTSNPRIWAAGDLTGHPPFTHVAGVHGSLAASNAVLGLRRTVDPDLVPRVTYTQPEVAAFGIAPHEVGSDHVVHRIGHDGVDRAIAERRTDGHSSLVLDGSGRVVGASLVGPHAGECLAEPFLAAREGLKARGLAGTMHAYPTWSDGVWKAALAQTREDLASGLVPKVTRGLLALQRRRGNGGLGGTR